MSPIRPTLALSVFLFLGLCSRSFGLAGDLKSPSLSFPVGFEGREKIVGVISDKQFQFLRGHFVNAHTTLLYAGDAASLNAFLNQLAACPGTKLSVTFAREEEDAAWTLQHNAWGDANSFHIAVNTARIAETGVKVPK